MTTKKTKNSNQTQGDQQLDEILNEPKAQKNSAGSQKPNGSTPNQDKDPEKDGNRINQIVKDRYGASLRAIARPLAEQFWSDLDELVMQEVAAIAEERKNLPTLLERQALSAFEANPYLLEPATEEGMGC